MAVRDIVTIPAPVLRRKARKVTNFGAELQALIDDMIETMRSAPGVGLAAPQVDVPLQVIIVEFGDEEDETIPAKLYAVVNPEITRFSKDSLIGTEGCLSIPDVVGDVERAEVITVKGYNRRGQPMTVKAKGWLARIFQHEVDHLQGVLFTDRAEKVWKVDVQPGQVVRDTV
jgi:peptide deformylase